MIAELNKIAIIHLFLLGFEDELNNFTLGLTNPSSQADLLRIDVWKEKFATYKEATTAGQEGIMPTSITWAKKHILGFSDEEIRIDLQQQRIERAVGTELTNTATIITHTGIFDNIDKLYGTITATTQGGSVPPPPLGGEEGIVPPPPGGPELAPESFKKDNLNILLENESLIDSNQFIDLSKVKNYLGEMEQQLNKLIND
jgi:hypothetical protein